MAKTARRKTKVSVKEMKYRHDPMIRFYEKTQDWLQERGRPFVIAVGIIAGVVLLYVAGSYYFDYRKTKAEAAFAAAVEKFNAPVQDPSQPATTQPTPQQAAPAPAPQDASAAAPVTWEEPPTGE